MLLLQAVDEAGPLWLLFESFLEWLGFWGRIGVLLSVVLVILVTLVIVTRRKK